MATVWRLFVQDYDFELAHVAGIDNIVADQLSRLCPRAPALPTPKLVQIAQLGHMPVTTLTALTTEELQGEEDQEEEVEGFTNNEYEVDAAGRVSSFVQNEPTKRQYRVIQAVHNSIAGHQGVENGNI